MNSDNEQTEHGGDDASKDEQQTMKRIFASLLLAVKNLSLYPPGHTISTRSINQFHTHLKAFLNKYGIFKLEIERERIICHEVTVSEEIPEEGSLHYALFRDGIRWITFMDGIEQVELIDIFTLINKYTKLSSEPEGDIVTALWEVQFPHIIYQVEELLWGGDLEKDKYSDLNSGKSSLTQDEEPDKRDKNYQGDPSIDMLKVMLSPEEEIELQQMIHMEEDTDLTSYLDTLLDSLLQNKEEIYFSKIIDALSEEFSFSLTKKHFDITRKILRGLRYILDICQEELPWSEKLIEDFFLSISSVDSLAPLKDIWEKIDEDDFEVLNEIFLLLNSKAIHVLLSIPLKSQPAPQRKMLLDLIILLSSRDIRSLEIALSNGSENLLERLFTVIEKLDKDQSLKYLFKLSHHSSGRIRYEAVKGILKIEPSSLNDMLNLIDDKEESIRQLILEKMGQSRDNAVEKFLISFIEKNKSGNIDRIFILQCFRILGRCGSLNSVPFLSELLLKWRFIPGSRRSILRRGAALALGTLGVTEAEKVLERAGKSLFPPVRGVVSEVMQELNNEVKSDVQ